VPKLGISAYDVTILTRTAKRTLGLGWLGAFGAFPTPVRGHHCLGATFHGSQGHASLGPLTLWTVLPTCRWLNWVCPQLGRLWSSGPGQFLGSSVVNRVIAIRFAQWLGWVFETQERKKERKNSTAPNTSPTISSTPFQNYSKLATSPHGTLSFCTNKCPSYLQTHPQHSPKNSTRHGSKLLSITFSPTWHPSRHTCTTCLQHCRNTISLVPTLSPLTRGTDNDRSTYFFSFFPLCLQFSLEAQSPQLPSKEDTHPVGKEGGQQRWQSNATSESTVPGTRLVVTTWVAHQSPSVNKETSLFHHSHPHADRFGTTRSPNPREVICALTAQHEWFLKRGPDIAFHIGRRVSDGHLKGQGPSRTWKWMRLNWTELNCKHNT